MILKGNQRAGGDDLASHLMNLYDNDSMELAQVRGTLAQDLHGALSEFEAHASGTRCRQALYSLSINPSQPITRVQYFAAIDIIENRLGLAGQPRAVVFHVKEGREHCHVVWSRIDTAKMRAVQLSHDHQKLRSLAQELGWQFGHELPEGLAVNRTAAKFNAASSMAATTSTISTAERAQADRSGLPARDRRAAITAAFRQSDSAEAFVNALWAAGYRLACGDQRGFVVVDGAGQVHSLARQIDGARSKDVKAKLAPLKPEDLLTVKQVRKRLADERADDPPDLENEPPLRRSPEQLRARQAERRAVLTGERQALELRQRQERMALHTAQKRERDRPFARAASAVLALFGKVPVLRTVLGPLYRNPKLNIAERHRLENEALDRRYERERANIQRRDRALDRVEARENRSLAREQRRLKEYRDAQRRKATRAVRKALTENKTDITAPAAEAAPQPARKQKQGTAHKKPRGYGYRRD